MKQNFMRTRLQQKHELEILTQDLDIDVDIFSVSICFIVVCGDDDE